MHRFQATTPTSIVDRLKDRQSYVGSTEVMAILGISRKTLCHWIKIGTLPAIKLGKNYACDPVQLAAWVEARSTV